MERQPPSWLQAGSHPAEQDRLLLGALVPQEGVVTSADLLVSQNATPNMTVNVAAGSAFVRSDLATHGGTYHTYNDAEENLVISAAHATLNRHDLVVAAVRDSQYAGGTDAWALEVLEGTPAASPVDPAIPVDGSYLRLARVVVGAAVTSITDANITDLRARAAVSANVATPVGSVLPYAGGAAPAGWLLADGSAVSRTTYAALFTVLGTTYGAGDGSSTFNLPDLRGRSVLGAGAGPGLTSRTLGAKGGAETHALTLAQVPGHSHTVNSHSHGTSSSVSVAHTHTTSLVLSTGSSGHDHWGGDTKVASKTSTGPDQGTVGFASGSGGGSHTHTVPAEAPGTNSQGGGGAHNNMAPFVALNHIVRAY